ncbi:MAG: hypothetical protein COV31_00950 [Candidatus Yanofskybacteria bacterium CG10_big_fil_rev_8_21_14_0_10_46_23]|uniref:Peptidase M50 domain-containing protein n=1 Tax=Candidatus Yanofskybacteria bacterium CG10_big_fil_rev_8_21_14_0_10_46_23 TaxID=1975098 RepID=A0A2H0R6H3_9BACT|nr:MAG: hypothetical protein COV31_00950 [Candidatus Yanofskybacteria bacterium CG10_big_fil_rev_8_21_14_0_10_46_23]
MTILIFLIVIALLVFVHELGHFIMAKRAGMRVDEFGLGFPPRIFGFKKGETLYSINLLPFGGFVRIFGEDGQEANQPRSFGSKSAGDRIKVIVAGVIMNILFAALLLGVGNTLGSRVAVNEDNIDQAREVAVQIAGIAPGSPADTAGLRVLDTVIGFKNGEEIIPTQEIDEIQKYIGNNLDRPIILIVQRGTELSGIEIIPRSEHPEEEGALGIALIPTGVISYPWYQSIYKGIEQAGILTAATVQGYASIIANIFQSGSPGVTVSGPIGIAIFTGQAARVGFSYLLQFTALISVNLAVLNIIPFPALDGGRLLFIIIEKIRRRAIPQKVEGLVNAAGFSLLLLLMVYITVKDVLHFL